MSSQIRQNYSTEVQAAVNHWPACTCGSPAPFNLPTYLCLGFYFDHNDVAPEAVGASSRVSTEAEGTERPLKMQNRRGGRVLLQGWQGLPHVRVTREAAMALEKNLNEAFGASGPGSTRRPQFCDFLVNYRLAEQVGLTNKMGCTWLPSAGCGRAGLGEYLLQRLTLKLSEEPLGPEALGAPLHPPGVWLLPKPLPD